MKPAKARISSMPVSGSFYTTIPGKRKLNLLASKEPNEDKRKIDMPKPIC
jgi:hypothetical protein